MSSLLTVKSVLMAIAAQGSVTVTIPSNSQLARDLGQVEITRQIGPVELRVQTAPEQKNIHISSGTGGKVVLPKITGHTAPAKPVIQAAPAKVASQTPPAEIKKQDAPVVTANQPAPAKVASQTPVIEKTVETAPTEEVKQPAPVETTRQVAPAKVASQTPTVEITKQDTPVQATGYSGLWYDHTGRSAIKITNCDGGLCGRIAWLKDSAHTSACGTSIIGGVKKVGNVYDNGWIYDIERGKKFDVELKLLNDSKLRVKGYAGTKWLSKTMVWHRAPGDLELCS